LKTAFDLLINLCLLLVQKQKAKKDASKSISHSRIAFTPQIGDTNGMDSGQVIYIVSRLVLGALASFFAIMVWSKIRDVAWMLMVIGTIAVYVETVYSILNLMGITGENILVIGSVPLISIILPCLPTVFFMAAFVVMALRKFRRS
jgi:hypothetical protein